jgi:hypothetical protein
MARFTDYMEAKIVNHMLRGITWTLPTTKYIGLFTAAPNDAGGGTEVTGGSYARVAVTCNTTNWNAPTTAGLSDNAVPITFPTATANWGDVVAIGIFDAASAGNLEMYDPITTTTVSNGSTASFANGALDVTVD